MNNFEKKITEILKSGAQKESMTSKNSDKTNEASTNSSINPNDYLKQIANDIHIIRIIVIAFAVAAVVMMLISLFSIASLAETFSKFSRLR